MTLRVFVAASIHGVCTEMGDERPSGTVFKHFRAKAKPGTVLPVMPMERHPH